VTDRTIAVPELGLVVLVGISGSGKSTFAAQHFSPWQVVSSDYCRGLVADDPNDQSATRDAFDVLGYIVGTRLRRGLLTVVDATSVQPPARESLVKLAREHDVLVDAIVLDVPERVARDRNQGRSDRDFGEHVIARQHRDLERSLRGIRKEGFRRVHVLEGDEIDHVTIGREKSWNDRRDLAGPFDLVGDVHGCLAELVTLLTDLGYVLERDVADRAVGARHPDARMAVFVGDLVDRGPDTPGVLRLVMGMVAAGTALSVAGNHEVKLVRALRGANVKVAHGLAESLAQLGAETDEFRAAALAFMDGLISHYVLDDGKLVVAHAGLKEAYQGRASGRVRAFALYGDTTGETDEYGLPVRYPWARDYRGAATVVYGHTPVPEAEWVNNTICLDTGVVFGGALTALRYPERELVVVPAQQQWYEPVRPIGPVEEQRERSALMIDDVLGERWLETTHAGKVKIPAENAAAALEVMSRFAVDPRWLVYLPPTMSPATTSSRDGLLEHPEQAFEDYANAGVTTVICEEKHMGSRAIAVLTRDEASAARRFGIEDGGRGVVYTRTGRSFFPNTTELVDRLRESAAPLFSSLETDWLVLDCELLPWSAKALGLIRDQYASVGAAARHALPALASVLDVATARGLDVAELSARTKGRLVNARAFRDAYAAYCRPTHGLDGVTLAPFQILAAEGRALAVTEPHPWHVEQLARLEGGLITPTAYRLVDLSSTEQRAEACAWWEELTDAGGEGMVVKPAHLVEARVQPGLKVRGREYLRIIYGPDYTDELEQLRGRNLGRKRQLAQREHGLGLDALTRFVAGEPLWRVHQMVFAVLALESEPVDPRL
jgi:polynucleotide kinase-phosphatase